MNATEAMEEAFRRAGGTPYKLARRVGISKQAAYKWRKRGRVGAGSARAVEEATNVPRELLRPDIFGGTDGNASGS